jgi:hypothetical protein
VSCEKLAGVPRSGLHFPRGWLDEGIEGEIEGNGGVKEVGLQRRRRSLRSFREAWRTFEDD